MCCCGTARRSKRRYLIPCIRQVLCANPGCAQQTYAVLPPRAPILVSLDARALARLGVSPGHDHPAAVPSMGTAIVGGHVAVFPDPHWHLEGCQ